MSKTRVVLVDDHPVFREGLRLLLDAQGEFQVVGEAGNTTEALEVARRTRPDIIVMDITMEGDGLEATRETLSALPQTKVLILTMHGTSDYFFRGLEAGAMGYVVKGTTSAELVAALQRVARGEVYIDPSMAGYLVSAYMERVSTGEEEETHEKLTAREKEVLRLVAQGHTNTEIAESLHISFYTVQTHRGHIMEKLNFHKRGELIRYAARLGYLKAL